MRLAARFTVFLVIVSATSCTAQQPTTCPWFSSGSAQTVLGGPVSLHLQLEESAQGLCEYASRSGANPKLLRILVGKADKHVCPEGSFQLMALGNEAVQCRHIDEQGHPWDVITGRVRNVFFVVTSDVPEVAAPPKRDAPLIDPYGASILERVAEQVVGNLD